MQKTVRTGARRRAASLLSAVLLALPVVAAGGLVALRWSGAAEGGGNSFVVQAGSGFPDLRLGAPGGGVVSAAAVLDRGARVLAIVDPRCPQCLSELAWLDRRAAGRTAVPPTDAAVVSVGSAEGTEELRTRYPNLPIYHDAGGTLVSRYGLSFVPVLLVVEKGGVVQTLVHGWPGERRLEKVLGS